jgi:hypothetical protein
MRTNSRLVRIGFTVLVIILLVCGLGFAKRENVSAANTYKILAWNDLGMHCYNRDFADLAVLPPYNTLWVQVVLMGNPPQVVTSGIRVEYSYADNTYSVGKTNFWSYANALFGVSLPDNIGLKGKGLAGTMDLSGDHFIAEGIPLTEYSDSAPTIRHPYQLATVVVKDAISGVVLASINVVTPTSSEMRCDNCHSDTGIAKPQSPTGKVETNILQLHDEKSGTTLMTSRPVLCANCHGSNALGMPGDPNRKNLSNAMHSQHAQIIPNTLDGCYNCHPGPQTRCLRDVMSTDAGMTCINCHGGMANVSTNPNPWLNEPRCDTCHNSGEYHQDQALYRFSKDHGGLYCEACHDSTHAVAPSREANDALKFVALQGENGPLTKCSVCHTGSPDPNFGPHQTINTHMISGNTGIGGVTLRYTVGTAKTFKSDISGNYAFPVPDNWSGTVTPVRSGYAFTPANRAYTGLTSDQSQQNYIAIPVTAVTFASVGQHDGWILESSENSSVGGTMSSTASILSIGDNSANKQYRALLSFATGAPLPDTAVITKVTLKLKQASVVPAGTNPIALLQGFYVDIRRGFFGTAAGLQLTDFQATGDQTVGPFKPALSTGWYMLSLNSTTFAYINKLATNSGLTQIRLRFKLDDNNNAVANILNIISGNNATPANRPTLLIEYYVP